MSVEFILKEEITENDYLEARNKLMEHFEVENSEEQIQLEDTYYELFIQNDCEQMILIKDEDNIVGTCVFILTSISVMHNFLNKSITERELLLKSRENTFYESIYLCSLLIDDNYKRKNLTYQAGITLIRFLLTKFNLTDPTLFYWPFSEGGRHCLTKIAHDLNLELLELADSQ